MKAIFSIILMVTLLFMGCTSHQTLRVAKTEDYASLNKRAKGNKAKVTLVDSQWWYAKNLQFAPDSTKWIDPGTGEAGIVPTNEIADIRFISRAKGAFQGLGIGLLAGAVTGALIGLGGEDGGLFSPEEQAIIGGIYLGGIGALLGISIGAAKGSEVIFHIEPEKSTEVPQKLKDSVQVFTLLK